jgi:hypothetical protein
VLRLLTSVCLLTQATLLLETHLFKPVAALVHIKIFQGSGIRIASTAAQELGQTVSEGLHRVSSVQQDSTAKVLVRSFRGRVILVISLPSQAPHQAMTVILARKAHLLLQQAQQV